MGATALVQAEVDAEVVERAAAALKEQGLNVSEAVGLILTRVARDGGLMLEAGEDLGYDAWFRTQIQDALDDLRPGIPNHVMKQEWAKKRAELLAKVR